MAATELTAGANSGSVDLMPASAQAREGFKKKSMEKKRAKVTSTLVNIHTWHRRGTLVSLRAHGLIDLNQLTQQIQARHARDAAHIEASHLPQSTTCQRGPGGMKTGLLSLLKLLHLLLKVQLLRLVQTLGLGRKVARGRYPFEEVLKGRLGVCPGKARHAGAQLPESAQVVEVIHRKLTLHGCSSFWQLWNCNYGSVQADLRRLVRNPFLAFSQQPFDH